MTTVRRFRRLAARDVDRRQSRWIDGDGGHHRWPAAGASIPSCVGGRRMLDGTVLSFWLVLVFADPDCQARQPGAKDERNDAKADFEETEGAFAQR